MIELRAGTARAVVAPAMGAALAGLWLGERPILRPLRPGAEADPFAYAMNILAPFSNRISDGIVVGGLRHALTPNLPGEPFPIHGDAFQRPWIVRQTTDSALHLALNDGAFGPLRYCARLSYHLGAQSFRASLTLANRADRPLPFGGGFHPWFPRDGTTRLAFPASGWWPEGEHHLPATQVPQPIPPRLRFDKARALPAGWINAGFSGWPGRAQIVQGGDAVPVTLFAPSLSTLILYSPKSKAGFFCLEPVSHPVDAHNLPGQPGLRPLVPGEAMTVTMQLDWNRDEC